jgi:hypothetical protein
MEFAPSYAPLSKEPVPTSPLGTRSASPDPAGKFDFSWESDVFHNQDYKGKTEDIDFRWNVDGVQSGSADAQQVLDVPSAATITAAADERANSEAARKREEASQSMFRDDAFHLHASEQEHAELAASKKNAEFQELLDEEFEKIKERQAEIDEERNRINEKMMVPPEPTPRVLVTGENARSAADERIQEYLRRADMEMRKAIGSQAEPKPEPKKSENFDPYESYGEKVFSVPDEQDTNMRAFGFKHAENDVAWEYEREDYNPEVSIIPEDGATEQAPSYLDGLPAEDDERKAAAPPREDRSEGGIFVTDFVNPFAADDPAPAASVSDAVTPAVPVSGAPAYDIPTPVAESTALSPAVQEGITVAEPSRAELPTEEKEGGIFNTSFANPFVDDVFVSAPPQTAPSPEPPIAPVPTESKFAPPPQPAPAPPESKFAPPQQPAPAPTESTFAPPPVSVAPLESKFAPPQQTAPAPPQIAPAPVTGMTQAPISASRRQAPDIVNKPVVFPFDDDAEKAKDAIFKVPENKTPEAHKPSIDTPAAAKSAPSIPPVTSTPPAPPARTGTPPVSAAAVGTPTASTTAPGTPSTAEQKPPAQTGAKETGASPSKLKHKKPPKALVVVVDILIVVVIILVACLALLKLAPDTGAAELISKAAIKIQQTLGIGGEDSSVSGDDGGSSSAADGSYVMPISDGDTLISSQLYNNYNIKEVRYDPSASWEEGVAYTIEGAAAAKPIDDDHWSDGPQGPLLYDESAVAAVVKFDSGLVDYINSGNTDFLNNIAVGSPAEKKIAGYVASVSQISVDLLGVGNIRKNGDDLYVWTSETVTETKGGAPIQRAFKRLYLLTPDVDTYKVSDYEDIG